LTAGTLLSDLRRMTRASRRAWLNAPLFVATILLSSAVHAQVPGEEIARRTFEEGVALEKKGDFAAALGKFKESEQIKPTLGNRYHKAYCLEMTGKLAAALIEYEVVDKAARDTGKTELVEATRTRLEPLRAKVPQLTVRLLEPRSAEVTLDGTTLAPALLDGKAFRVDPGEHVVAARAQGYVTFDKRLSAPDGTTTSVDITLPPVAPVAATPAEAPRSEAPSRSLVLPILTTAGAVVLAGAGVGAFVIAGQEQDELEKKCYVARSCEDDKSSTRTLDALALGSWIGAAGLAALSIVLWTSRSPTSASARVTARSSWLGIEGRF
jgi:hypothetical protein